MVSDALSPRIRIRRTSQKGAAVAIASRRGGWRLRARLLLGTPNLDGYFPMTSQPGADARSIGRAPLSRREAFLSMKARVFFGADIQDFSELFFL